MAPTALSSPVKTFNVFKTVRQIPVADNVIQYAINVVRCTRPGSQSPQSVKIIQLWRGSSNESNLILGEAGASQRSRKCRTRHIRALAVPVLRHRMVTNERTGRR